MDALGAHDAAGTHHAEGANESGQDEAEGKEGEEGVGTGVEGVDHAPLGVEEGDATQAHATHGAHGVSSTRVKIAAVTTTSERSLSECIIDILAFREEAEI